MKLDILTSLATRELNPVCNSSNGKNQSNKRMNSPLFQLPNGATESAKILKSSVLLVVVMTLHASRTVTATR